MDVLQPLSPEKMPYPYMEKKCAQVRRSVVHAYLAAFVAGLARPGMPPLLREVPTFLASLMKITNSSAKARKMHRSTPAMLGFCENGRMVGRDQIEAVKMAIA
jgi:hypothetical protein